MDADRSVGPVLCRAAIASGIALIVYAVGEALSSEHHGHALDDLDGIGGFGGLAAGIGVGGFGLARRP